MAVSELFDLLDDLYPIIDAITNRLKPFERDLKKLGLKPLDEMGISEKVRCAELVTSIRRADTGESEDGST